MTNLLSSELISKLRAQERRLKHRYGVRVVVQKITADGVNLLCSAWRSNSPLFKLSVNEHEVVELVHDAMRPLSVLGLRPLVSVVPKSSMKSAGKRVKADPFRLQLAMQAAGIMELGPTSAIGISKEESERRIALLQRGITIKGN